MITTDFIFRSNAIHNNKYDYSKVSYVNNRTPVIIICPKHGEFKQAPMVHLRGCGCVKCGIETRIHQQKIGIDKFVKLSNIIHGFEYDYSNVNYINNKTKVNIICHKHGEFKQTPTKHLSGQGCPMCHGKIKMTKKQFIDKANIIHNDIYDYSKSCYISYDTKLCIICPIHDEFFQTPNKHLSGQGCPKCRYIKSANSNKSNESIFISKAVVKHENKYDYSKVIYNGSKQNVIIICPDHGEFMITPNNHLRGEGCPVCGRAKTKISTKMNTDKFIDKSNLKHGYKYDYSNVKYVDSTTKITIVCLKHGKFEQQPNNHLFGQGCPLCKESKLEKIINHMLTCYGICYERQKRFPWLGRLSLDFYLPKYNVAIECQGKQHFGIGGWNDVNNFKNTIKRDNKKNELCALNGVTVKYFSNLMINYPYFVYEDVDDLIHDIIQNI